MINGPIRRLTVVACWSVVLLLVAPSAVITLCRALGLEGPIGVRAVAFTPLALPPYAVALVLLAVLAGRPGRRRAALLVAMPVLGALLLHVWWAAPLVIGAAPVADPDARELTVMTANVMHDRGDAAELVATVAREQVDLLVVPEIGPRVLARMEETGIDDLLPFRAGSPGVAVEGTMLFATEPITEVVRLPTAHQSWQARIGELTVFAVHPAYPKTPTAWRSELAALVEAAERVRPDLLLGDFNATLDHRPMQRFAAAGYRSAAELANSGWQPTWPANGLYSVWGVGLPPVAAIDQVLLATGSTAAATRTVTLSGTDHRALIATVAVGWGS